MLSTNTMEIKRDYNNKHESSIDLVTGLINHQTYIPKKIRTLKDIEGYFSQLYKSTFNAVGIDSSDLIVKLTEKRLDIRHKNRNIIKTFEVENEEQLKEIVSSEDFKSLERHLGEFTSIEEYTDGLLYNYKLYSSIFHNKNNIAKVKVILRNGRAYIYYDDFTGYNMENVIYTEKNSENKQSLLDENLELAELTDIEYKKNNNKESVVSFNTGFIEDTLEEHTLILSMIAFQEMVVFIDNLYIKYGITDVRLKYTFERVLSHLLFYNFRVEAKTTINILDNGLFEMGEAQ